MNIFAIGDIHGCLTELTILHKKILSHEKFDVKNDPESVEIDFVEARVSDHSAIEAIFALVEKYQVANKKIILKHLSEDCKVLLYKASPIFTDIIEEDIDDPRYHLAANPEDFTKPLGEYKF